MFGSLGATEILVLAVIGLLVFGPRRLPQMGRTLGKTLYEFRKSAMDLRTSIEREINLEELKQTTQSIQQVVRDGAGLLAPPSIPATPTGISATPADVPAAPSQPAAQTLPQTDQPETGVGTSPQAPGPGPEVSMDPEGEGGSPRAADGPGREADTPGRTPGTGNVVPQG